MYPFPHAVTPAAKTHIDAQADYLNDMSKAMFESFQQMCQLNIQLFQTMLEEGTMAGKQLMKADQQSEILSAATSRAQPATDKLRAYQQHMARLAADSQVELARVTEQHAQTTARTARALADEVARTASEQTERGLQAQQENVRRFADPFSRSGEAGAAQSQMWTEARGPQSTQGAGHGGTAQHAGGAQQGGARAPEHG
jgi:phasin family protein